jgi:hypothetical protein
MGLKPDMKAETRPTIDCQYRNHEPKKRGADINRRTWTAISGSTRKHGGLTVRFCRQRAGGRIEARRAQSHTGLSSPTTAEIPSIAAAVNRE